jgi:hypothetical protein
VVERGTVYMEPPMAELVGHGSVVETGVTLQQLAPVLVDDDEPLVGANLRANGSIWFLRNLFPEYV